MFRRSLAPALCLFSLTGAAHTAYGFALKQTPTGEAVRWRAESSPLSVALDVEHAGADMRALFAEATSGAIAEWNAASALRAELGGETSDADIVVTWTSELFGDEREELATTMLYYDSESGAMQHAIIRVNDSIAWLPDRTNLGVFDLQGTLTHELGHAYGLGHSDVPSATMFLGSRIGDQWKRTLDADDIEAVQRLYGAPGMALEAEAMPSGCSDVMPAGDPGVSIAMMVMLGAIVAFNVSQRVRRAPRRARATRDHRGAPGAIGRR